MGKIAHSLCEGGKGEKKRMEKTDEKGGGSRRKRYCPLHADIYCGFLYYDTM